MQDKTFSIEYLSFPIKKRVPLTIRFINFKDSELIELAEDLTHEERKASKAILFLLKRGGVLEIYKDRIYKFVTKHWFTEEARAQGVLTRCFVAILHELSHFIEAGYLPSVYKFEGELTT